MANPEPEAELDARFSDAEASPTPWREVRRAIEGAELFWIATVRADGRPHVTPLPAIWDGDALYFCTGASEQKQVNLAGNAHCALTTGTNNWKSGLDVVVEGTVERVRDESMLRRLAGAWASKYHGDWQFDVRNDVFVQDDGHEALVYAVRPAKVLAFAKGTFAQTRFRFRDD